MGFESAFSWMRRAMLAIALFACSGTVLAQAVLETPLSGDRGYSGIAVGTDGTVYIAEYKTSAIAIVSPDRSIVEVRTITSGSGPIELRMGPDGNVWFVERLASNIGVMKPDGTMLVEWSTRCTPTGFLAVGSGNALWFSEQCFTGGNVSSEFITKINTTGTMSRFRIGVDGDPVRLIEDLVYGPDGAIWFAELSPPGGLGRLDPVTGKYSEYLLPTSGFPGGIFAGPDGNLWVPESTGHENLLNRVDIHGAVTQFDWTGPALLTMSIGPGNSLWGVDHYDGVWRIDLAAESIAPVKFPSRFTSNYSFTLTSDKDYNLWFSEYDGCAVARIDMDALFNDNFDICP